MLPESISCINMFVLSLQRPTIHQNNGFFTENLENFSNIVHLLLIQSHSAKLRTVHSRKTFCKLKKLASSGPFGPFLARSDSLTSCVHSVMVTKEPDIMLPSENLGNYLTFYLEQTIYCLLIRITKNPQTLVSTFLKA